MKNYTFAQMAEAQRVMSAMLADEVLLSAVAAAAGACIAPIQRGGQSLLAGNGGSAAFAQHIAGEFVSLFAFDRFGLPAIALTTDTSILAANGNDRGYEKLFGRQLQTHDNKDDVFVGYSTSGKAPNVLRASAEARGNGPVCAELTGNRGGPMQTLCDYLLVVPSSDTPKNSGATSGAGPHSLWLGGAGHFQGT
jgi:D-sedoheptulose 7-phosphate isomerase